MKYKICVIGLRGIPSVVGGIETQCQQLYPRLAEIADDLEITVVTRRPHEDQTDYDYRGVAVKVLRAPKISGIETAVHTFLALIYTRLFLHPDLVHLHGIGPGLFTLMAKAMGFRTVVTHHAPDFERPKWGVVGRVTLKVGEYVSCRFADRVICVSDALKRSLLERYPFAGPRTQTIRNGGSLDGVQSENQSDVLERLGLEPGGYILAVGRLEATKAFHELVDAFERAGGTDRKLVIVGTADASDRYSTALKNRGSDRVLFVGAQFGNDLRMLYEQAAIFMHPSHMEGFGLVVAEAISARLPVAISDIPAHREFALGEQSYFRVGDVDAMARIMRAEDLSAFRSPAAIDLQLGNTWDKNAALHLALFRSLQPA